MTEEMPNEATKNVSKFTNLEPNVAAALSYLISPFTGIAFFVIEKEDKFVRFHAMQSILTGGAFIVLWTLFSTVLLMIGLFIMPLLSLAGLLLFIFLIYKAYKNEKYELPYLGKLANDLVEKGNKQI